MGEHAEPNFIVGIGASAGGLEALQQLFSSMPTDLGAAYVVVQHLAPDFKSLMDELLARHTRMPIHPASNNIRIEANNVYLIPPRKEMVISDGKLLLADTPTGNLNLPIDVFFRSLAADARTRAISIVLSGTGSDGSGGIKSVAEAGGLVIVQSPESAKFDGMPNSALATHICDQVLEPGQIGHALANYIAHPHERAESAELADADGVYGKLYAMLLERYQIDFDHYKPQTIARRIERRLALARCETIQDYAKKLEDEPEELDVLYHDLLIGVTEFFRDPEAWATLEDQIIPELVNRVADRQELRLWVAGCATGQEAYSLAILLHEQLTEAGRPLSVKIFATDVHRKSLETASVGFYPKAQVLNVSEERLARYFTEQGDGYYVAPEIRRLVVFAPHNIAADPPFTNIDLVSCRNLLIYLNNSTQAKALGLFHFSLNANGYLVLGPSETLGVLDEAFTVVDKRWRVYRKSQDVRVPATLGLGIGNTYNPSRRLDEERAVVPSALGRDSGLIRAYDALMERYMPPSMLVDKEGSLVHTFGTGGDYMLRDKGLRTDYLVDFILPELRTALATALRRARKDRKEVSYGGLRLEADQSVIRLVVVPVDEKRTTSDYFLVTLESVPGQESTPVAVPVDSPVDDLDLEHIKSLETELQYTRENLQATVEELETSNEELQATNEELMAANEELQSTNEELHSVNEELYTVNSEYEEKISELNQLNEDISNLIESTDIGTVFLDADLLIRKFTPAAGRNFALLKQDIGRPIAHLKQHIEFEDLDGALRRCIETGKAFEQEVAGPDKCWFLMRLNPCTDFRNEINGLVMTFVDVSNARRAAEELRRMHNQLQDFSYVVSHDLREPARMVESYCGLIAERYEKDLDDEGKEFLHFAVDGARRTGRMIDALLRYSRVVSRGEVPARCSVAKCLANACEKIEGLNLDNVEYDNLPTLEADERQLTELFTLLLDNAVDAKDPKRPLQIRVAGRHLGEHWSIEMHDNGLGLGKGDPEKLLRIFVRGPEAPENPERLGVGLSIAQRIVERHGGELNLQNRDSGVLASFTLPAAREETQEGV